MTYNYSSFLSIFDINLMSKLFKIRDSEITNNHIDLIKKDNHKIIYINRFTFNSNIDILQDTQITELVIDSSSFNQPINKLPDTLKYLLIFSGRFNQPLDNLPQLTHLSIGGTDFNQSIDNLPNSLLCMQLCIYNKSFINKYTTISNLPNSLKLFQVDMLLEKDETSSITIILPEQTELYIYGLDKSKFISNVEIKDAKSCKDLYRTYFREKYNFELYGY